jgi:hypothetical protein
MPERHLPARPNLEQYKKQAKELARDSKRGAGVPTCAIYLSSADTPWIQTAWRD